MGQAWGSPARASGIAVLLMLMLMVPLSGLLPVLLVQLTMQ
jgi:hypothetical protein